MRKARSVLIAGVVTALFVGIMATPGAAAPEKIFSLKAPASLQAGAQSITLTIKNETPTGNSQISSFKIAVSGGVTITGQPSAPRGQITWTASSIEISNAGPIKNNQSFAIAVPITATTSGCGGTATWDAQAWTGSPFNGDTFRLLPPPTSNLTTAIAASATCSLRFNPAPANAILNANIPVTVQVVAGSPAVVVTGFTGNITLAATTQPSPGALTGVGTVAAVNGQASFTLAGSVAGNYQVSASSSGMSTINASFVVGDANLSCDPNSANASFAKSGTAGNALLTLTAGGACTTSIPVTIDLSTHGVVNVIKPFITGSAFTLQVAWAVEAPVNPLAATQVDYGADDPIPNRGLHAMKYCAAGGAEPANELWCIIGQDITIQPDGNAQLTEHYIGTGDPKFQRSS